MIKKTKTRRNMEKDHKLNANDEKRNEYNRKKKMNRTEIMEKQRWK